MKCLYRVRPYEVEKGSANKLYELWDTIVRETIEHHGYSKTAAKTPGIRKGYLPYKRAGQGDREVLRQSAAA